MIDLDQVMAAGTHEAGKRLVVSTAAVQRNSPATRAMAIDQRPDHSRYAGARECLHDQAMLPASIGLGAQMLRRAAAAMNRMTTP
jgi:hypothetical protein